MITQPWTSQIPLAASTTSSNPSRLLGATGDERCFDDAEPRRGPPGKDYQPGRPKHGSTNPPTLGAHIKRPTEPFSGAHRDTRGKAPTLPGHEQAATQANRRECLLTTATLGVRLEPDRVARARLLPGSDQPGRQVEDTVLGREMLLRGPGSLRRVATCCQTLHGVRLHVGGEPLLAPPLRQGPGSGWLRLESRPGLRRAHVTMLQTKRGSAPPPPPPRPTKLPKGKPTTTTRRSPRTHPDFRTQR